MECADNVLFLDVFYFPFSFLHLIGMSVSSQTSRRLAHEFKGVKSLEESSRGAVKVALVNDSLVHWSVELSEFEDPLKSVILYFVLKGRNRKEGFGKTLTPPSLTFASLLLSPLP